MASDISSWAGIEKAGAILKDQFLTAEEFAGLFRYSVRYVRQLARDGKIPGAFKFGGQWLFRRKEVEKIGN